MTDLAVIEKISEAFAAATMAASERLGQEVQMRDPSYEEAHELEEAAEHWVAAEETFGAQMGEDWLERIKRMAFADLIEQGWLQPGPEALKGALDE